VGLDLSLRAWILEAPSLEPTVTDPTGTQARVIFYQEQVDVEIENSQEGVDYQLVYSTATAEEVKLSEPKRGDLGNIKLRSYPVEEDVEIWIRATKTFDPSEERETETNLLAVKLPLRVRANPELTLSLDPGRVISFQQPVIIKIGDPQESVKYQLYERPIRDRNFYPQLCPEAESVSVSVEGETDPVQVCRPPWELVWTTPEGFVPKGEPVAENGGELAFKIESLQADHLFIICAQKLHSSNGKKISSQVQLRQAATVLVGPDPDPPLTLQVMMNGKETNSQMLVQDGQPGVFYYFRLGPEGEELELPAYFHQRNDDDQKLNKGLEQLGLEKDFVIGRRSATDSQIDPATAPPASPLLETGPLPSDSTLHVRAKKAMNRVSTPLTASASIPDLPQIRLQDPIVDYDKETKILVIGSVIGDKYLPYIGNSPLKKVARLGNEGDLSFNTNLMKENTTYFMHVTRPDEKGIPVKRVVELRALVRPNTVLSVSPEETIVAHNSSTTIQVKSSQPRVNYQLLADEKSEGKPVAGNGETISLPTGPLIVKTTFIVRAVKAADPDIAVILAQQVTIQILPDATLPVNAADAIVPFNGATDIRVETSQAGVNYQLLAGGNPVGDLVAGNNETISLPTGPLTVDPLFTVRAAWSENPDITVDLAQTVFVQVQAEPDAPPVEAGDGGG
jgi:hypothetical protein